MVPPMAPRVLLLVTSLAACVAPATPPAAPSPPLAATAGLCRIRGLAVLWENDRLYLGPELGAADFAVFTGSKVDVEIAPLDVRGDHRVRTTVRSDGFVLRGWIAADAVTPHAARDLAVLGPYVTILRGARLRVVAKATSGPRVEAIDTDFAPLATPAVCDALEVEPPARTPETVAGARYVHLRGDRVRLLGAPGGAIVAELDAWRSPTLSVLETRGGASRIVSLHAMRVTGWMRDEDLEPGEGPDCDDCYGPGVGDAVDRCPDLPEAGNGREVNGCPDADPPPLLVTAPHDLPIRAFAARDAAEIGLVEKGARVYVVGRQGAFARVRPLAFVVTPSGPGDFWVEL
jgi:hypothetical protein